MQKNEIQNKNQDLSKKIVMMQEIYAQGFDEKERYMEGALWMGKRVMKEIKILL
jgi:hypothetical protein